MAGFRSRPKPLQAMDVQRWLLKQDSALAGWRCRFAKSVAVKSVPTPPSRPHPANPLPDIRRRHVTHPTALRELQRGSPHRHRLEPRQQFVGDEPRALRVRMLVALAVIVADHIHRSAVAASMALLGQQSRDGRRTQIASDWHSTRPPIPRRAVDQKQHCPPQP